MATWTTPESGKPSLRSIKEVSGIIDACHVTEHACQRLGAAGRVQNVTIKVYEAGPDEELDLRYHAKATSDDGRTATGPCRESA